MALFEDIGKGLGGGGLATGLGFVVVAPVLLPVIGRVVRPVARGVLEAGITIYREVGEAMSDVVDEARAEMDTKEAVQPRSGPAAPKAVVAAAGKPSTRRQRRKPAVAPA